MARLFISYKREEQDYAFAIRQWLMDEQGWASEEVFIDRDKLRAGDAWAEKIFAEAEKSEVMLFLASEASLQTDSFCYKELQRARGVTLAVTIKGLSPDDDRLRSALPHGADARQITALDGQPTDAFAFVSPIDGSTGVIGLNRPQVESIGQMLRDLGVAPNSFSWRSTEEGPYPGLASLQEGDEALFFGRDLEIRDCIRVIEEIRQSVSDRALLIQAPSGAGKSSFLRAGLWRRLRRHAGFTPLAIIRTRQGALFHEKWGLASGLARPEANRLQLAVGEIEARIEDDLPGLLEAVADADASSQGERRTLLLGIDQAEEMAALNNSESDELTALFQGLVKSREKVDIRIVLTARDDSVDATLRRLEECQVPHDAVRNFRLNRMPHIRFAEVIRGPAASARRASYPIDMDDELVVALSTAATSSIGEIGDSLPILALALHRLVRKYRAPNGRITLAPDKAAEFLRAAVEDATQDALSNASTDELALRRLVIPRLVTWDPRAGEAGAAKRQVAIAADLFVGERSSLEPLAGALVDQRLLTKTSTSNGTVYEVAHEALLRANPLGDLIRDLRVKFLRSDMLTHEAQEWIESNSHAERLARAGERLREAQELFKDEDFRPLLSKPELRIEDYLAACDEKDRKEREQKELYEKFQLSQFEAARRLVEEKGAHQLVETSTTQMRLFVSYSRADLEFADNLTSRLEQAGFDVVIDRESIHAGEDWKQRLVDIITGADTVVFLVSSASIESQLCGWEIEQASRLSKRIIPVAIEETTGGRLPQPISGLNSVLMRTETERVIGFDALVNALLTDLGWLREHTRLLERAHDWERAGRPENRLLVGTDVDSARDWRASKPANAPDPIELQLDFINESGKAEALRQNVEVQRLNELASALEQREDARRRVVKRTVAGLAASIVLIIASVGASMKAYNQQKAASKAAILAREAELVARRAREMAQRAELFATQQRDESLVTQSRFLADLAEQQIERGNSTVATLLALEALPDAIERKIRPFVDEAEVALRQSLSRTGIRFTVRPQARSFFRSAISPDGQRALAAFDEKRLQVIDLSTGQRTAILQGHESILSSAQFSPDGTRVLTASIDNTARIWRADTGEQSVILKGHTSAVLSASFSPDATRIVTSADDNTVRVWDAVSGKSLMVLNGHSGRVTTAAFSPDGLRVLTASRDGTARLWDARTGTELVTLAGHSDQLVDAAFSPNAKLILTASADKTARLWNADNGSAVAVLSGHKARVSAAVFSPDGKLVATASDDAMVRVWKASSGVPTVLSGHNDAVESVTFSSDGVRLLTGSRDGTARIWRISQSQEVVEEEVLRSDGRSMVAVAFSPDGRLYVTSSEDGTLRAWSSEDGELPRFGSKQEFVDYAKGRAGKCLSIPERAKFYLTPEPPRWCITGPGLEAEQDPTKWKPKSPYETVAWKDWLVARDNGKNPSLPSRNN